MFNGRVPRPESAGSASPNFDFTSSRLQFCFSCSPATQQPLSGTSVSVHSCALEQFYSITQALTSHLHRKKTPVVNDLFLQPCLPLSSGRPPSATSAGLRTRSQLSLLLSLSASWVPFRWPLFPPSAAPSVTSTPSLFLSHIPV